MESVSTPEPAKLAAGLAGLLRDGLTTQGLRQCPALLHLELVKAKSASEEVNDLAVAASTLLREAAEREEGLIEAVADELYAADSAYRLRHRHRTEAERSPEESRLGIDWLAQHRSYRRIWTPVMGMRNDLDVLRRYLAADEEDSG